MSVGGPEQIDLNQIEQTRRHINALIQEVARIGEQDLSLADYFREFMQRALAGVAAPGGALWLVNSQGHLLLQNQHNLQEAGIQSTEESRQRHDELLRQLTQRGEPTMVPARTDVALVDGAALQAGNPTDFMLLLAPILVEKQVAGILEVMQLSDRNPLAMRGFLQFLVIMADLAGTYLRGQRSRQLVGQQQLLTKLESFLRQIHGSLNPTEVAYMVANEGRRIIDCDRVSVAQRANRKTTVAAISGADVVEKRSNLVQLMRALFDSVLKWGERLIYTGTKDEGLPPNVLEALDNYLAESNSKMLAVMPLRDEREVDSKNPGRSAIMLECFESNTSSDVLVSRLDAIGKHVTGAMYNAVEHRNIPLRYLWQPVAKIQEGLGGKTRAIVWSVSAAVAVLVLAMIIVPYPLKMDAKGQLLPQDRRWIYSPVEGQVERFEVEPGEPVYKDRALVLMRDTNLELKVVQLQKEIDAADKEIQALSARYGEAATESERLNISNEKRKQQAQSAFKTQEYDRLRARTNSEESRPGYFWLKAPIDGTVLNFDFQENLTQRYVKPSEPLLRIGDKNGPWEIELKVPQKHIGQVLQAFDRKGAPKELDVDLLLMSKPTQVYKGKLARDKIAGEANPDRSNNMEAEPVVPVLVRIDGDDIPEKDRLPRDLLLTGTEVHSKIRCGYYPMGYSLFYGVWEFLYEKVVFFF